MKTEMWSNLVCPKCKNNLTPQVINKIDKSETYGVAACRCASYPIVAGVLVLKKNALTDLAANAIKRDAYRTAAEILLTKDAWYTPLYSTIGEVMQAFSSVDLLPSSVSWYIQICGMLHTQLTDPMPDFSSALDMLVTDDGTLQEYFLYRPFEQSFWNLHATIPMLCSADPPIIDVGGGCGHSSQLIRRLAGTPVINIDTSFTSLYLYKQYVDPEGMAVAVDPGEDLPVESDTAGAVIDLDGFHYISNKYGQANEYERISKNSGIILLLHTHTQIDQRGTTLPSDEYAACFSWDVQSINEELFLKEFLDDVPDTFQEQNSVGTNINYFVRKQESEPPATIGDSDVFGTSYEFDDITINPLYDVSQDGNKIYLYRKQVPEAFREEFNFSFRHSSAEYEFSADRVPPTILKRGIATLLPSSYRPNE